jgi:hypothetical protein
MRTGHTFQRLFHRDETTFIQSCNARPSVEPEQIVDLLPVCYSELNLTHDIL